MTTTIARARETAARLALDELHERQAGLRVRRHALGAVLARRFNQRIPVPPEVARVSVADASRELEAIDRELDDITRRIDEKQVVLAQAARESEARDLESVMPEYRARVEARDRAEADLQAFLADCRRRGIFLTPATTPTSERG